ncbi:unnamed protein product [Dicrocoelium dendriticum]|nr:unnamed protein product [Dicrocoelium dendriticum]
MMALIHVSLFSSKPNSFFIYLMFMAESTNILMDGALRMLVKPGSKMRNLVPFAVEKFKSNDCQKVVWTSVGGATGKTVSCAEQFKQLVASAQTPSSSTDSQTLYQFVDIRYDRRLCVDPVASVRYCLEEPCISIYISKTPLPQGGPVSLSLTSSSFLESISAASSAETLVKPPTRRCLAHKKRRKRDRTNDMPRTNPQTSDQESLIAGDPLDESPLSSFVSESPRLAPALQFVSASINESMHKNRKRKR